MPSMTRASGCCCWRRPAVCWAAPAPARRPRWPPARANQRLALPRFAAARRASDRRLSAFALLGLVLVEHRLGGGLARGAELGAVVAAPLKGGGARGIRLAEMRHHIAGIELVGPLGRLP